MLVALSSNSNEREGSKKSLSLAHTVLILLDWSLHSQLLRLNAVCCRRKVTGVCFSLFIVGRIGCYVKHGRKVEHYICL